MLTPTEGEGMLPRIKHLFRRAYAIPSKIDEIIVRLDTIDPIESKPELTDNGVPKVQNPFWHWQSSFDAIATMRTYADPNVTPTAGRLTNYLGVRIDPAFFPGILGDRGGTVEPMPSPNNWHADVAEFAAALRAVDLAGDTFTVAELGCGWGCWLNNTGIAAKRVGKKALLIGIEGDEGHLEFARQSLPENGFDESEFVLYHGIAAGYDGVALFPRQEHAGGDWGLEPILNPSEDQVARAKEEDSCEILPTIDLASIVEDHGDLDLLHIDIQGGETALLTGCIETCNSHVRYVLIGTHSRIIEGQLEALMLANNWILEVERPGISTLEDGVPVNRVDGVQGWRNSRLT